MKTKSRILIFILALLSAVLFFNTMVMKDSYAAPYKNTGRMISAVGNDIDNGNVFIFVTEKTNDVVMSFDLLKTIDSGYFGIVDTLYTGFENYLLRDNFTLFNKTGGQIKSSKITAGKLIFDEGYNYKITITKEKRDKTMVVERKALVVVGAEYEKVFETPLNTPYTGAFGLALQSDGWKAASIVIDNVKVLSEGKTLIDLDFDSDLETEKDFEYYATNTGSFMSNHNELYYTVSFYDLNGNLLQQSTVCEYNYADCNKAPVIEGKVFKGWSERPVSVERDMVVYPVYMNDDGTVDPLPDNPDPDNPDKPDPDNPTPDKPDDNDGEKGGCGGIIDSTYVGVALMVSTLVVINKRRRS